LQNEQKGGEHRRNRAKRKTTRLGEVYLKEGGKLQGGALAVNSKKPKPSVRHKRWVKFENSD